MALEDADFSDEFCQFLQSAVPAVEAAELLLLLKGEPGRSWSRPELVRGLGAGTSVRDDEAERYLEGLKTRGLVSSEGERLQYRAPSGALADHVTTLEKVYRERPVTLIRVIYGLRDSKIRSFADAFRLRRK